MISSKAADMHQPPQIDISIVLCTFDRPASLARCLHALQQQQTPRTFEIIVVDNHPASNLTTPLIATFPSVRWEQEALPGLSRARNRGIAAARGTVLVTTDDDVIPPPGWLDRLTQPLFAEDGPAATTGNCLPLKLETQAERLFEAYGCLRKGDQPACFDATWMQQWHIGFPHLWQIGATANAAFRTSVLRDPRVRTLTGPFEEQLGAGSPAGACEDLYCFYRILQAGYRICYLPGAVLLHAHREQMPDLTRQMCAYCRGETAFLTLILRRHRDPRALAQALLWIPYWRLRLFTGELLRRLRGTRKFSLQLFWKEILAYFGGPGKISG
jgi:glycosyltransferase involved in cell wall biosynthesis